jgi:hypothetical protein
METINVKSYVENQENLKERLQHLLDIKIALKRRETLELKIENADPFEGHEHPFIRVVTSQYFVASQKREWPVYFLKQYAEKDEAAFERERKILTYTNQFSFAYKDWHFLDKPKGKEIKEGDTKIIFPELINDKRYGEAFADEFYDNRILIIKGIDPEKTLKDMVAGKKDTYWLNIMGASDPVMMMQDFLTHQPGKEDLKIGNFSVDAFQYQLSDYMLKSGMQEEKGGIKLSEMINTYLRDDSDYSLIHYTTPESNLINGIVDTKTLMHGPRAFQLGVLYGDSSVFDTLPDTENDVSNIIKHHLEMRKILIEDAVFKTMIPPKEMEKKLNIEKIEMGFYLSAIKRNLGKYVKRGDESSKACAQKQIEMLYAGENAIRMKKQKEQLESQKNQDPNNLS